jgi:phenylacetate-CoA ligase
MKTVITNAEPLFEHQREAIREAFGCSARESYGMAEMAAGASKCGHERLHLWPDAGVLELDDGKEIRLRGEGDFICTGLINEAMPLIRYRVGDRGVLSGHSGACECGRTLPVLDRIEGRNSDLLVTRDGRRIFWLNPVFDGLPVVEAQICQESLRSLCVRLVVQDQHVDRACAMIRERLQRRIGDVEIHFERVTGIPRTSAGKFRPVICKLTREEIEAVEAEALRAAAM